MRKVILEATEKRVILAVVRKVILEVTEKRVILAVEENKVILEGVV